MWGVPASNLSSCPPSFSFSLSPTLQRERGRAVRGGGWGGKLWAFLHQGNCPNHGKADICSLPNSCWQLDPLEPPKLYRLMAKLPLNPFAISRLFLPAPTLSAAPPQAFEVCLRITSEFAFSFPCPHPKPNSRVHLPLESHPG